MSEPILERSVGLPSAVGFGLGAMVGTGLFVTTAIGAGLAGPAVLVSLLVAGAAAACNGLSSASLAMTYPRSGGTYEYAGRTLHPWAGFLAGWLFLAAKTTSAAATALAFGAYVGDLTGLPSTGVALALTVAVTVLNLLRLTKAGAINLVLVLVSLSSLVLFVSAGASAVSSEHFHPFAPGGIRGILSAAPLLFVAYAGYGRVATLGEEITNPRRNIPIAVVLSISLAVLLYLAVTAVAVGSIGAERFAAAAKDRAPLREATGNAAVSLGLAIGAAAALASVFLNLLLGLSRMAFAMARGGDLPSPLSAVGASSVPRTAVIAVGLLVGGLVAVRSVVVLLAVSAFAILVYYSLTNLSALKLTRDQRLVPPIVSIGGLISCLTLIAAVPPRQMAVGAGILAAGVLWRLIFRRATSSAPP